MAGEIHVDELGPKGDGISQSKRGRVYIDRALPGETVRADIRRGDDQMLRGEILAVVEASPHRVKAPCPNYDVCGGCTLQHADDAFYRDWKVAIVRDALRRKGLTPKIWRDPVFVPPATRRRATFNAHKHNGRVTLGYFRRRTHRVTDIRSCLVADPAIMALRDKLAPLLVPIVTEGKDADIFIQTVGGRFELAITGAVGKKGKPDLPVREAIAELAHKADINRISWRGKERGERDDIEVMIERNKLIAKFGTLEVALPPLAFLQPTMAGEAALVEAVMELLPASGKFADLFAGSGTFSGPMLARGPVDAFESVAPAVRALDKAKDSLPLKAIRRDLDREPLRRDEANRYDAIVFDPPRAGAAEQAKALASAKTPVLVAVSCNPATFARDARLLVDGGYRLDSVKVIDQFTWSHHVELVAGFSKRP
ncbi:MAG TPA: class I SAM-dependent RNA methyltransferase [Stellaceae bacterium]|jgi:23S rRNA (uracil1939-C5)-methyltransferase|nr:class I SAM-dependent RNA methyltransferase [Stellaceae bacterium]